MFPAGPAAVVPRPDALFWGWRSALCTCNVMVITTTSRRADSVAVTRVLVVDDHDVVRHALAAALNTLADIDIVGCCVDGVEAVAAAARLRPDVVVMDLAMPRMGGLDATREILAGAPETRIVVLTAATPGRHTEQALAAGACACLYKDAGLDALIATLRSL